MREQGREYKIYLSNANTLYCNTVNWSAHAVLHLLAYKASCETLSRVVHAVEQAVHYKRVDIVIMQYYRQFMKYLVLSPKLFIRMILCFIVR